MSSSAALIDPTMPTESINTPESTDSEFAPASENIAVETILIDADAHL